MFRTKSFFLMLVLIFVTGCATTDFGSVQKTTQLSPGMSYDAVVQVLGEPKASRMEGENWIVSWTLHEYGKGFVPYDMKFDDDKRLVTWHENEAEYQKNQARLKEMFSGFTGGSGAMAGDAGPNNPQLMQWIAGYYYNYSSAGMGSSSGTERKLMLCPNGTFNWGSESGYSGGAGTAAAWGAVGQGGHSGRWAITGNQQQGNLTLVSPDGEAKTYEFSACGNGCFYFGSLKFGYAGQPQCQ